MTDPCTMVNAGIFARLSDAAIGFNAVYNASGVQGTYQDFGGAYVPNIVFDWSQNSPNFTYGLVPPDLIESTSPFAYPLLTISSERTVPKAGNQRVHYQKFHGTVYGTIQVHISWEDVQLRDFETLPNAVIAAMLATMNAPSVSAQSVPNSWGTGVLYSYDLAATKSPILTAGQNWRRILTFTGSFEVLIP